MPGKPARYQNVSCVCGADVRVDSMNRDRRITCRNCGNSFDFAVTMDNVGQNSRISLILPRGALKTEGESLGLSAARSEPSPPAPEEEAVEEEPVEAAPPPPVSRKAAGTTNQTIMGHCECGSVFPLVDDGELTSMQSCPHCDRAYHVVFKLEPGTREKTAIIVPEKPIVHRRTMLVAPPKSPKGATKVAKTVVPRETTRGKGKVSKPPRSTTVSPKSKAPKEIPIGAQAVPCSCGEIFIVRRKDLEQEQTCSGCGRKARFQESRHPQTLVPILRIRPD